ncbi:hypothetical protein ASF28_08880 [Methylobacterium sp. Leaf99]|uniref:hypothetical protein n=1 Tax=Methylobacterium sp. Leaf99 TaxID=1736251 RepID=UPI0006F9AE46|nr:hypothetical protein [Methylobacterium sp. Leaf99]KQP11147.1 hypothetical protein ASF28_08880 [Methylobacterium sp. Leaf99]
MRYHPPAGSALPNAPYVGKNIALQQQGSRIPPQVPEYVQREIVNVVELSGQVPTDDDLTQIARAIRLAGLQTFTDTSATPGYITVGSPLAVAGYAAGMPFSVTLNQDVTGPTLLNYNGLGPRVVVHNGGGALQRGDYRKGDIVELRYNATTNTLTMLTPVSEVLINAPIVKTIAGFNPDFKDCYEAIVWISRRRISNTGYVTFQHAAGVGNSKVVYSSDIRFNHADQSRVAFKGAPLNGSLPQPGALAYTGNAQANRVADTATNLNTMRGIFTTEISFVSGARFVVTGDIDVLQDVLFTSDGSGPVKTNIFQGYSSDNLVLESGNQNIRRIASFGAQQAGISTLRSETKIGEQVFCIGNGVFGANINGSMTVLGAASIASLSNGLHGFHIGGGLGCSDLASSQIYARGNPDTGVFVNGGSLLGSNNSVSRDNGGAGIQLVSCAIASPIGFNVSGNPRGLMVGRLSFADSQSVTGSATDTAFYAYNGGQIIRSGSSVSAPTQASPAAGTSGNGNAFIV